MTGKTKKGKLIFLIVSSILVHVLSYFPSFIERYYSNGIYPFVSAFFKYMFGWIPFSIGDVLYILVIGWLLIKCMRFVRALMRKSISRKLLGEKLVNALVIALSIYLYFNVFWGLNYNRQGIARQLGIEMKQYSKDELQAIDSMLLDKVNGYKAAMLNSNDSFSSNTFPLAKKAYENIEDKYPFLHYQPSSIKASLFGTIGNYIGFTGYYNPFTGEAQLNTTVPVFLRPFTTCHEIAHQLGYAKENEANFVGYLAAANAKDNAFRYSVYLDLFLYAQRNLFMADSVAARNISKKMLPAVKNDLLLLKRFYDRHRSPLEPVFRWVYSKYLQSNQQPSGLLTYDQVTGFLIAFHKKYGVL